MAVAGLQIAHDVSRLRHPALFAVRIGNWLSQPGPRSIRTVRSRSGEEAKCLCYDRRVDELFEFLVLSAQRLDQAHIPYMLSGSVALSMYAQPRMTRDVDFVIEITERQVDAFLELFEADCYVDRESVFEAVRSRGMFNVIHQAWVVKADFVVRKDQPYRKVEFERRRTVSVAGNKLTVVTAEDLLLSKLHWAKDSRSELQLGDVRNLMSSEPNLDWPYIRQWAEKLGVIDLLREVGGDDV